MAKKDTKKGTKITLRLEQSVYDEIDQIALKNNISKSKFIQDAIYQALNESENQKDNDQQYIIDQKNIIIAEYKKVIADKQSIIDAQKKTIEALTTQGQTKKSSQKTLADFGCK